MKKLYTGHECLKFAIIQIVSLLIVLLVPLSGSGADLTTRYQTIVPRNIPPGTPPLAPSNVSQYVSSGYGAWDVGPGANEGRKFNLMPVGYAGAANTARLLSFFSMSDIHITDKESPAQVPYLGWSAAFGVGGPGGLNESAYSPIVLDTTFHLDAAVKTINAMHRQSPFDFGMVLGDNCNASQFNELRWFIDVMDGSNIVPSSGAHLGATSIDYQMPYQAAGLDRSIPWYEAVGNHDQYWMGVGLPTPKIQQALIGSNILNISTNGPLSSGGSEGEGMYVGTVDGTTPFGTVIDWGLTNLFPTAPTVAADASRHTLTTDNSSPTNYINEFFNSASLPQGHGFNRANTGVLAACYTFEPLTNLPIKVIVLDDTCKSNKLDQFPTFYGAGWVDAVRYTWLTNELQEGQDADQLMILACHIPIAPQDDVFNTNKNKGAQFYPDPDNQTETNLIATLQRYPNLLMVMAGHRHLNVVTPFPSQDPAHPEYGFWEVETASLRDFPRQFRTWKILRNSDNSVSIVTTDVDPHAVTNSPAWKSIGYGVGAGRLFGNIELTNTYSHTYNAELVKQLTTNMQAKIALFGLPINRGHDFDGDGKSDIGVLRPAAATWYRWGSSVGTMPPVVYGAPTDLPLAEDFDGDGKADFAAFRPSTATWYRWGSLTGAMPVVSFGAPTDIPVPADFDGDGKADFAVFRPSTATWYRWGSLVGAMPPVVYGAPTDLPIPADYDGDGKADLAVFRPATAAWYRWGSLVGGMPAVTFGSPTDIPVPGNYDNDGIIDFCVFRPSTATWYIFGSKVGPVAPFQYGVPGDRPLGSPGNALLGR
jgi:metallophosphoesterase (TIGR03768 family)